MTAGTLHNDRIGLLIAGLGNSLLMDDGVGVHAVRALQGDPPPGATVVEVGTAVLDALHLIERAGVVLALDAVEAGGAPGTIYEVRPGGASVAPPGDPASAPGALPHVLRAPAHVLRAPAHVLRAPGGAPSTSLHELDLRGLLCMLPEGRRPDLIVLGVEPEVIDYGLELSPTVRDALPEFVETVRRTAQALLARV